MSGIMVAKVHIWQCSQWRNPGRKLLIFSQYVLSHILLKAVTHFITFEQSSELSVKIWKIFCINSLFKEQWFLNSLLRHCTQNTNLCECRGFSCSARRFAALHILMFWPLMYPLRWTRASSIKAKLSNTWSHCEKPCCWLQNYSATGSRQSEARQRTCAERLSKLCCVYFA
jgi:hypothetical protein